MPDSFGSGPALADVQDAPAGDLFYPQSCGNIRRQVTGPLPTLSTSCSVYFSFELSVEHTVLPCQQH